MTSVKLEKIAKGYQPGKPVLKPLDLEIRAGELFFLLGPSGCGKSTLLRILAGLLKPDSGRIFFNDTDVTEFPPEKRQAAMVFQSYALWPHLSVFENVAFGLRAAGTPNTEIRKEVERALEIVRLADCADRKIPSLSGGQQQRVALARALAVRPKVLLLDEPLSNLDARLRDEMRVEIRRIVKERELTALYVTHDRQEALSMGDRIAVMEHGTIRQLGAPEEVYERPADRFTAEFLGDINFIPGTVSRPGAVTTPVGGFAVSGATPAAGTKVSAAIRPERIRILPDGESGGFPARLVDRSYYGDRCEWRFEAAGIPLTVLESAPPRRTVGAEYRLFCEPDHLLIFGE